MKSTPHEHPHHDSHRGIVLRLKRAEGHLRSTIAMIESGRNCVEIAQQLHAIEKAITNAKKALIHDHVDHCLEAQAGADTAFSKTVLAEFKEISKYL
ncbi:metal-sensing transcriptional repressor [Janthinobacterium sp.]|uniref:metal-sensing transcriptional repressor n=1 Tax=Janthinobacterium sp. TaxID=1871054 RepID=UPI0026186364|nr:metal-sensing transcriptional repressor [Janthinobacterium sp.]